MTKDGRDPFTLIFALSEGGGLVLVKREIFVKFQVVYGDLPSLPLGRTLINIDMYINIGISEYIYTYIYIYVYLYI